MAWEDYTHADVFGMGIMRPASDVLAVVESALDARVFGVPGLARKFLPLHKRDILVQRAENYILIVISQEPARHRPMHIDRPAVINLTDVGDAPVTKPRRYESEVVANDGLIALGYDRILEPLLLLLPPNFLSKSPHEVDGQAIRDAAEIIFQHELQRYVEQEMAETPKKIFLSHKSIDKAIVREVAATLREIGFDPWLDEDAMVAGSELERALKAGMTASCAAVFFLTSSFTDKSWLKTEIEYAVMERRKKEDRFAIVPLLLKSPDGKKGQIPDLIEQYVYRDVEYHQIVREILKAIPVQMEKKVLWKAGK